MIDPSAALAFSVFKNRGVFALPVGSGVSRAAQIPTGWEVVLNLTRRVAALEGVPDQVDRAAWHQERFGEPPNYSKLLDALAQTAEERRSILHAVIEPSAEDLAEGRKTPTRAHRAIARLVRDGLDILADRGYFSGEEIAACEAFGVTPYVPKPLTSNAKAEGRFGKQDFTYLSDQDVYRCPAGSPSPRRMTTVEKGLTLHCYWDRASCQAWALKPQCTPNVERRVTRWEHEAVIDTKQGRMP